MKDGIPKKIKKMEQRVALTFADVHALTTRGHTVYVETGTGLGSGIPDEAFEQKGAVVLPTAEAAWDSADMVIKLKEPVEPEFDRMKPGQILLTYLHLAADFELTRKLLKKK